jgi:alkanesulfonate monooxygenase SsuD/methylene tetrahydromethanopterin reductase-like flavin-dependent oxidoreductase (luciferase family)
MTQSDSFPVQRRTARLPPTAPDLPELHGIQKGTGSNPLSLWATPEDGTFSYPGTHYQLANAPGLPKPRQRAADGAPRVPLILGGRGPVRTPRLAARFADEFNVGFASPAVTSAQISRVSMACEAIDRDPSDVTYSAVQLVCLGSNSETLKRRLAATGRKAEEFTDDGLAGSIDRIRDKLAAFAKAGVSRMYLQFIDLSDMDHLAELGELNELSEDLLT